MADKKTAQMGEKMVVQVPVRKATHGYKTNHLDISLTLSESERLADIFSGLQRDGATLKNGKLVGSPNQAIVWILQNMRSVESSE